MKLRLRLKLKSGKKKETFTQKNDNSELIFWLLHHCPSERLDNQVKLEIRDSVIIEVGRSDLMFKM